MIGYNRLGRVYDILRHFILNYDRLGKVQWQYVGYDMLDNVYDIIL